MEIRTQWTLREAARAGDVVSADPIIYDVGIHTYNSRNSVSDVCHNDI